MKCGEVKVVSLVIRGSVCVCVRCVCVRACVLFIGHIKLLRKGDGYAAVE